MPYILVFIIVFSPLVSHAQTFDNAFANISGLQDFINNLSQKSKNISLSGWIEKFKQGTESPAIKKIIEVLAVLGEIIDIFLKVVLNILILMLKATNWILTVLK